MEAESTKDRIELEQALKEQQELTMQHITDAINSYYAFRKNVLIGAIIHIDAPALENPDTVGLLHAHSVYNSHTGRLLICFESPSAFSDYIRDKVSDEDLKRNNVPIKKVEEALVRATDEAQRVEFLDLSKMSLQDYFKSFEKKNDSSI
jgi:hypothetical protein